MCDFLIMSQEIKYLEILILGYSFRYGIHVSYSFVVVSLSAHHIVQWEENHRSDAKNFVEL